MKTGILVTGGAGYIGSHACKALAACGYTPVTLDNLVNGRRELVRWGPFVREDLADVALVRRAISEHRVQAVMHFAGYSAVGESMRAPGKYFENNFGATLALLEAMRAEGVRDIVFSSSCATYGVPHEVPITEAHPQTPSTPTASRSSSPSGCSSGTPQRMGFGTRRSGISTPPEPTPTATPARITIRRPA